MIETVLSMKHVRRAKSTELSPEEAAAQGEQRLLLRDLVKHLPGRQKLVVALRYFAGLDVAEAARVLATSRFRVREIEIAAILRLQKVFASRRRAKWKFAGR